MSYISDADFCQRLEGRIASMESWQVGQASPDTTRRYFDWLEFLVEGFWAYIIELAHLSGDTSIYFYDLEQATSSVFLEKFGVYPLVQLDAGMTEDEYITALREEPGKVPGKTFAVAHTCSYLIFPQSGKWYIHGEYSIEMAELVSTVGVPSNEMFPHDFWSEAEALRCIESMD